MFRDYDYSPVEFRERYVSYNAFCMGALVVSAMHLLVCTLGHENRAHAQTAPAQEQEANDDPDSATSEREQLMREMQSMVDQIKIVARNDKRAEIPLIPRPLFRYNSPSREYDDGTIWGWGKGRPLAMMELWTRDARKTTWVHGMALTSTELVDAFRGERREWQPLAADIAFRPIPDADRPADNEAVRLRQIKQFARLFTAHQFWSPDNSRFELRLLVQPVHRYRDDKKGIIDAAVFLMAHEIEPEVIILIEAVKKDDELSWQYGVTPIGAAEFHIHLSGEEIYRRDREYGGRTKTTIFFSRNAIRD